MGGGTCQAEKVTKDPERSESKFATSETSRKWCLIECALQLSNNCRSSLSPTFTGTAQSHVCSEVLMQQETKHVEQCNRERVQAEHHKVFADIIDFVTQLRVGAVAPLRFNSSLKLTESQWQAASTCPSLHCVVLLCLLNAHKRV